MIRLPFFFKSKPASTVREKKQLLHLIICFRQHAFSVAAALDLLASQKFFEARLIQYDDDPMPFTVEEQEKLQQMDYRQGNLLMERGIKFFDDTEKESLSLQHPGRKEKPQVLYLTFHQCKRELLDSAWFLKLITRPDFFVAYCGDEKDIMLQSTTSYVIYQSMGIKPTKTKKNDFGDVSVDLSANPGRRALVRNMWLMSCWKMWFGANFYTVVPYEKLKSFPDAAVATTAGDITCITLYQDPFAASDPVNRARQQSFRDWIDLDGLEKVLE